MKLTIVGERLAKEGQSFTYEGETDPECAGCRLRNVCHGDLKVGRTYTVTGVRPVKHDVCHVFEGLVQVVEIDPTPAPVRMAIPVAATRGTGLTHHWEECGASCLLKAACDPPALKEGQAAAINRVQHDVPCLVGRKLKFADVEPA